MTFELYENGLIDHFVDLVPMIALIGGSIGVLLMVLGLFREVLGGIGLITSVGSLFVFMAALMIMGFSRFPVVVDDERLATDQSYAELVEQGLAEAPHITQVSESFYETENSSFSIRECELTITGSNGDQRDVGVVCLADDGTTVETT